MVWTRSHIHMSISTPVPACLPALRQNGPRKLVVWTFWWSVYSSSILFFLDCLTWTKIWQKTYERTLKNIHPGIVAKVYFANSVQVYFNISRLFAFTGHCSNQDQWRVSDAKSSWIVTSGLNNYKSYKHIVSTQEKKQTRSCLSDKLRLCTLIQNQEFHSEIDPFCGGWQ